MRADEKRSHRLGLLLRCYMRNPAGDELFRRAKLMGVSDSTAHDYTRTVIARAHAVRRLKPAQY